MPIVYKTTLALFLVFSAAYAQAQSTWLQSPSSDIYAETYTDPLRDNLVHFQRLRFEFQDLSKYKWSPYLSAEHYKNDLSKNLIVEGGVRALLLKQIYLSAALRQEKIDDSDLSFLTFRTGAVWGFFRELKIKKTYFDAYFESFLVKSERQEAYSLAAGWFKYGYRAYSKNNFVIDPITLGMRFYENSRHVIAGDDYLTIFLGPQIAYFLSRPKLSTSLLVSYAKTHSRTGDPQNDIWAVWALGVN